jgi:hypothetical protein
MKMKKRRKITAKIGLLLLLFAALAMIVMPQAWATQDDIDDDGILNDFEGPGECLPFNDPPQLCIEGDPEKPDLFIQLVRTSPSMLPENPFEFITRETETFFMDVHVIGEADAQGQLISGTPGSPGTQYAVKLKENLSANAGDLGVSQIGVPTQIREGSVFPLRIQADVDQACALQATCIAVNSAGVTVAEGRDAIYNYLAQEVCSHEIFHMLGRVVPKNRKVDYHYPMLGYIMDHHMTYKVSNKAHTVTWTIHDRWAKDPDNDYVDVPRFK